VLALRATAKKCFRSFLSTAGVASVSARSPAMAEGPWGGQRAEVREVADGNRQARACNRIARLGPDRGEGAWQTVGNKLRLLTCRLDDVRIALQTPLQQQPSDIPPDYKISCRSPREAHAHAFALCDGRLGRGRVLSLQWADDGSAEISPTSPARGSGTCSATSSLHERRNFVRVHRFHSNAGDIGL
jgi:hypothetical protein